MYIIISGNITFLLLAYLTTVGRRDMKWICLILVLLVAAVNSKFTGLGLYIVVSLVTPPNPQQDEVEESGVRFFLHTRKYPDQAIELLSNSFDQVDARHPVKLIIHGWSESAARPWIQNMTREYLKKDEYNVIQVDYAKAASERYTAAVSHVGAVGVLVGRLIVNLNMNFGLPLSNFHIIAHSLGAHVAGAAGKEVIKLTRDKLPRITALDAAAPLFATPPLLATSALVKSDAKVLDAIHTDGNGFGYRRPLGDADFFPNGGTAVQPGCPPVSITSTLFNGQQGLDDLFCSHTRSYVYFISSINNDRFISTKCSSWDKFKSDNCENNLKTPMGDPYMYSPETTGSFYLRTNPTPPFAVPVS